MLLYANDLDIAGIVYSASTHHWNGDGVQTLEETGLHVKVNGNRTRNLGWGDDIMEWRPMELGWIENLILTGYEEAYPNLVKHDPRYPTPGELVGRTAVGNIEFENDMRFDTAGSNLIRKTILDDDPRTLYLQAWGGANTIGRALMSIEEEFSAADNWDEIREKVNKKVVIIACGDQDYAYEDYISVKWPDVLKMNCAGGMGFSFASDASYPYIYTFQGDWLMENIKFGHGTLNRMYRLYGDGQYIKGELDFKQFGIVENLEEDVIVMSFGTREANFNRYDFISEGDSPCWMYLVPNGLRGLENHQYGSWGGRPSVPGEDNSEYNYFTGKMSGNFSLLRWLDTFQNDWAARADWCVAASYEDANHAPVVDLAEKDIEAAPGTVLKLECPASDPDGDELSYFWEVYGDISTYAGELPIQARSLGNGKGIFVVPSDAADGDMISIVVAVTDNGTPALTRYAQYMITVAVPPAEEAPAQ